MEEKRVILEVISRYLNYYFFREFCQMGDEASYLPNCQTNLVFVPHAQLLAFHNYNRLPLE